MEYLKKQNKKHFVFTVLYKFFLPGVHTHITAQLTPQPFCHVVVALCPVMSVA